MFRPATFFLGLRYTRAKRGNRFISFISMMSIVGIALGVTVLITTLSVLNGFDREIKKSIFSMMAPVNVTSIVGQIKNWQELEKITKATPGVTGVAPYIVGQGLLENSDVIEPAKVIGILPSKERSVIELDSKMVSGKVSDLRPGKFGVILGEDLADSLGVKLGEQITLMTPKKNLSVANITPSMTRFTVVGIFRAGGGSLNFNSKLAYVQLNDAQKVFDLGASVSAIHAKVNDIYQAPRISAELESQVTRNIIVTDWTEQLGAYFENIQMTKTIMFFIFILIIVVAIFNLIGTLVMVVNNKRADIAILRTLGATPNMIMGIFIVQGAIIGAIGTALGVAGGVLLAANVTSVVDCIQHVFHVQLISSNVYFVDYLPSELQWGDIWRIGVVALTLSLIATIKPAWTAAKTHPAQSLRYD